MHDEASAAAVSVAPETAAPMTAAPTTAAPQSAAPKSTPAELAWLVPGSANGRLASAIVEGDANGHELRRLTLPREPLRLWATSASQKVLAQGMDTWMWVDLAAGKVIVLNFGAVSASEIFPRSQGKTWWVLSREAGAAFLLELATGKLVPLAGLGVGAVYGNPTLLPGETAMFLVSPGPAILTFGPSGTFRQIASGKAIFPSYSPDGSRILYTLKNGTSMDVTSEKVDGTDGKLLLHSAVAVRAEFAADTDHLLVIDTKGIALLDVASGKAVQVSTTATIDSVVAIQWSNDRKAAVIDYRDSANIDEWLYVDTVAQKAKPLLELASHSSVTSGNLAGATGQVGDYQLFAATVTTASADFKLLDFATGTVQAVSDVDTGLRYVAGSASGTGRWFLAETMTPTTSTAAMREWLIDGSKGSAVYIEAGPIVRGSLSPDGTTVAGSTWDGKSATELDLFDLASGKKTKLGPGFDAVWVAR